jgi:hypothetical protein
MGFSAQADHNLKDSKIHIKLRYRPFRNGYVRIPPAAPPAVLSQPEIHKSLYNAPDRNKGMVREGKFIEIPGFMFIARTRVRSFLSAIQEESCSKPPGVSFPATFIAGNSREHMFFGKEETHASTRSIRRECLQWLQHLRGYLPDGRLRAESPKGQTAARSIWG